MTEPKKSDTTRRKILATGRALVLHGGFTGVGLSQILRESGVPKGSFYHYFPSKEAFGCALLHEYVGEYLLKFDALAEAPGTAGDRLAAYWDVWLDESAQEGLASRCLVVKLAAEIADLSDDMRRILDAGVEQLVARIAALLREGAEDGSLRPQADPMATAGGLYAQWLGAAILSKLARSEAPLRQARADTALRLDPQTP
ncbi:TetR/AcrR family transcriptional regulator [Salipiger sp. PrR002]|uniref:TetR/AcrR family transcriptional regulator n=1 Tax=Salipiger sp. PrR002 TaxID=2706489 RepID=UPI0013BA10AE|nr:TetR/AcrR family transcriptional regulator [Salipiger sp. PrR002]NDV99985.1 TetR/AcrR family transcriptional regulator [Salipiger sp. PrR002]NDW56222.1 TetR/AcrR family transcriptional regulator [Salipiger sp. PrR004]